MGPVTTFYLLSYADHEIWDEYQDAMTAAIVLYGNGMSQDHKDAFTYGDAFKVHQFVKGSASSSPIVNFIKGVDGDTSGLKSRFADIHNRLLTKYGAIAGLQPGQADKIAAGRADWITEQLKAENNGVQPTYCAITWVAACSPPLP